MNDQRKTFWGFVEYGTAPTQMLETNPSLIEMPNSKIFPASVMNILRHSYGFIASAESGTAQNHSGEK